MKKILVLYDNNTPVIDAIIAKFNDLKIVCSKVLPNDYDTYSLIVCAGNFDVSKYEDINILTCHKSLLPAFDGEEPVKEAILEGVKVTGISIYYTKTKKIVAQYPIFIQNDWHYDELDLELQYLEQSLFPLVIENILKNDIIDLKKILKPTSACSSCSGGNCANSGVCSNCGGCNSCKGDA